MRSKKRGISELEVITLSVSFVALVMTVGVGIFAFTTVMGV